MIYGESEFSRMKWAIHKVALSDSIFDNFLPIQQIYTECLSVFNDTLSIEPFLTADQAMRFTIYAYHQQSPFVQRIGDVVERKKACLKEAGVNLGKWDADGDGKAFFVSILLARHEFMSYLSLTFLKFENNLKWTQACMLGEMIAKIDFSLQSSDSGKQNAAQLAKTQTEAYTKSKDLRRDYDKVCKELFNEDMQLQNYMASYILKEKRKAIITPERYVQALQDKKEVFANETTP